MPQSPNAEFTELVIGQRRELIRCDLVDLECLGVLSEPELLERFADDLQPELAALPGVRWVDVKRPRQFFEERALYYLDIEDLTSVRDRLLAREAALKFIRIGETMRQGADSDALAALSARFEREARAIAVLESSHTVRVYDYGVTEGGGTQVRYLSGVPHEKLGLPKLGQESFAQVSEGMQHTLYKGMIAPLVLLGGLIVFARRSTRGHKGDEDR